MKKYIYLFITSFFVIGLDQLTKWQVAKSIPLLEKVPVIEGFFDLRYVHNRGAAFGLLSNAPESFRIPFFFAVSIVAVIVILLFMRKVEEDNHLFIFSLSFIFGGALGNFIDRLVHGYVIDFLDFRFTQPQLLSDMLYKLLGTNHWPAFNVADVAIVVGVGLMMIDMIREYLRERREVKEAVE